MTAAVQPFRPKPSPSVGPCGSGTNPGGVSPACGETRGTRLFICGRRCPAHFPINRKTGEAAVAS